MQQQLLSTLDLQQLSNLTGALAAAGHLDRPFMEQLGQAAAAQLKAQPRLLQHTPALRAFRSLCWLAVGFSRLGVMHPGLMEQVAVYGEAAVGCATKLSCPGRPQVAAVQGSPWLGWSCGLGATSSSGMLQQHARVQQQHHKPCCLMSCNNDSITGDGSCPCLPVLHLPPAPCRTATHLIQRCPLQFSKRKHGQQLALLVAAFAALKLYPPQLFRAVCEHLKQHRQVIRLLGPKVRSLAACC